MKVLITGVEGQDGTILSHKYIEAGWDVIGVSRNPINQSQNKLFESISFGEIKDSKNCRSILNELKPDHILHLAAVHAASTSMDSLEQISKREMTSVHVDLTRSFLLWQKNNKYSRLGVALSSQMYTPTQQVTIVDENTSPEPMNFYGTTTVEAFDLVKQYRHRNRQFAIGFIFFNHTSIYSKEEFLFQLLARQIAGVIKGDLDKVQIRNFDSEIDISSAHEVCEGAMQAMFSSQPRDWIFSSSKLLSVRSIVKAAFFELGVSSSVPLISTQANSSSSFNLVGNTDGTKRFLGWETHINPGQLLASMVSSHL
jgi:GDP-D-mannose dehydratase